VLSRCATVSHRSARGPSVPRRPAFRLRFSQEVLFQRRRGLSVLRRPARAQPPLQQALIHARARHEPQEVKALRPVAFIAFLLLRAAASSNPRTTQTPSNLCHGYRAEDRLCHGYPAMNAVSAVAAFYFSKLSFKQSSPIRVRSAVRPGSHGPAHTVASLGFHPWGSCASPRANPSIERTCHGRLRLPRHAAHVER
jgi:hypothetical protein